jgi:hypothetical protein
MTLSSARLKVTRSQTMIIIVFSSHTTLGDSFRANNIHIFSSGHPLPRCAGKDYYGVVPSYSSILCE